ncbi:MAG: glycosyltransferase [Micrococcales bacterium]|nr:glycosyltransferase [Micrococcales bacterium]
MVGLDYYAPYVSGLTNSARDIAEGLAGMGWRVTVVAAQHSPRVPLREVIGGVEVIRVPTVGHIGKGVISPRLPSVCVRHMSRADVGLLHLPMAEAGAIATMLRRRTPLVAMYHCDVHLPPSLVNRYVERAVDTSSRICVRQSEKVVVTSTDYLASSRLRSAIWDKHSAIPSRACPTARGACVQRWTRAPRGLPWATCGGEGFLI